MFTNWETFIKNNNTIDDSIKFQYAILFRKYEVIFKESPNTDLLSRNIHYWKNDVWIGSDKYILKNCIEWNYGYIYKALDKEIANTQAELKRNILEKWREYLKSLTDNNELDYYTTQLFENKNLFELFFDNQQPMLDVCYYAEQEKASKQLHTLSYQLIFDEVGTGKTVSALYCIRDVLNLKGNQWKVLIVCPNNKKNEWRSDIQRQLGRYAHIVENSDNSIMYKGIKELFFKKNEPFIFIEGQKEGQIKKDCNLWHNDTKWDIVIIDEGHLCFNNYNSIHAEKAVLLTATPIVVNSNTKDGILEISKLRKLNDYIELLEKITGSNCDTKLNDLFEKNSLFVQLFREDLKLQSKKRNILFLDCNRWDERENYLDLLSEVKGGMTRLVYEQDDDYLLYGVFEKFKDDIIDNGYLIPAKKPEITNKKLDCLFNYLNTNPSKSYIVFCNYIYPADNIYSKLIDKQNEIENIENTIIIKKYGGDKLDIYPKDSSVSKDNVFDYIANKIDNGSRIIFITTGASGGTGLNLGMFDGVINYELPFTCIELEQRFGRVDRMNSKAESKDMIFILNKDMNPMLRYSVLKINATCMFMPIRNTILFYPQFIQKNIEALRKELTDCIITEDEKQLYEELIQLQDNTTNKKLIETINTYILKKKHLNGFNEEIEGIEDYVDKLTSNDSINLIISRYHKIKKLEGLNKEVNNWVNLLSSQTITDSPTSAEIITDDDEEQLSEYTEKETSIIGNGVMIEKEHNANLQTNTLLLPTLNFTADVLITKIDGIKYNEQEGTTGLFYIKDNRYIRQTVVKFREGI